MKVQHVLAIVSLLFTNICNAELIRGSGRGSTTSTSPQALYLLDDTLINSAGLVSDFASAIEYESYTTGLTDANPAPEGCYFYSQDWDDDAEWAQYYTPCYYQFTLGQRLQFEGFSQIHFNQALSSATWRLSQGSQYWIFASEIIDGIATLDVPMPADLRPGQYSISLNTSYIAGDNRSFFHVYTRDEIECNDELYAEGLCGYRGSASQSIGFSGYSESVLILPVNEAPVVLLFALSGWVFRRQQRNRQLLLVH